MRRACYHERSLFTERGVSGLPLSLGPSFILPAAVSNSLEGRNQRRPPTIAPVRGTKSNGSDKTLSSIYAPHSLCLCTVFLVASLHCEPTRMVSGLNCSRTAANGLERMSTSAEAARLA